MSLTSKFDKFKTEEDNTNRQIAEDNKNIERYDTPGHTRNICFVETNRKQIFLNYSYLISGEFIPDDNTINLAFTTHTVSLHGYNLEKLFDEFSKQTLKAIVCLDERYASTKNESDIRVTGIKIKNSTS